MKLKKFSFLSGLLAFSLVATPFSSSVFAESDEQSVRDTVYEDEIEYVNDDEVTDDVYGVTDEVYGDVTDDVYGDVTDDVYGGVTDDVYGDVTDDVYGGVTDDVYGDVTDDVYGDVTDDVYGSVTEDIYNLKDGGVLTVKLVSNSKSLSSDEIDALKKKNGKLSVDNGEASFTIPASNLPSNEELIFEMKKDNATYKNQLGPVYDFTIKTPSGKTVSKFNQPVTLMFKVDSTLVKDPKRVKIFYYNETTGNWENYGGTYDAATGFVTTTTTHFSKYGVFLVNADEDSNTTNTNDDTDTNGASTDNENTNGTSTTNDTNTNSNSTDSESETTQAKKLPETGTNTYTFLLIGLLLTGAGAGILLITRSRNNVTA
jgi:LPXTG-motif cell wall-anchored protein